MIICNEIKRSVFLHCNRMTVNTKNIDFRIVDYDQPIKIQILVMRKRYRRDEHQQ